MQLRLRGGVAMQVRKVRIAEFTLTANQSVDFLFEDAADKTCSPVKKITILMTGRLRHGKPVPDCPVIGRIGYPRSAYQRQMDGDRSIVPRLVLKLLTSAKYGSIIAAPTFGLPESIGGKRNWDYRYTWIRDASFTVYSFIRLGYTKEAGAFMNWVEKACKDIKGQDRLGIMYSIDGEPSVERIGHSTILKATKRFSTGARSATTPMDGSNWIFVGVMDAGPYLYGKHARTDLL